MVDSTFQKVSISLGDRAFTDVRLQVLSSTQTYGQRALYFLWHLVLMIRFRFCQGDGTRRIPVPERTRIHTRALLERRRFPQTQRHRTHIVRLWPTDLRRATLCRHVGVVCDRQGVGRVQDVETPGRERGGDPGGTEVHHRTRGVSDPTIDIVFAVDPGRVVLILLCRHPLPFRCRIVPRFPGMDAEGLEQLIAGSTP